MLIGVVSDNHGLIDPALPSVLAGVEEIWHAGDLVTPTILSMLEAMAPVVAVRGNNDLLPDLLKLEEERVFEREGHRVLIRHIVGPPSKVDASARRAILRHQPRVVVMGHSHRPLAAWDGGVLFLNPGSCGPRRFSLPRTVARLELDPRGAIVTSIDLDTRVETRHRFQF